MREETAKRLAVPELDPIAANSVGMRAQASKQAKKVRRGPAESVQVTAWFIRRARITLGQAFSWGGLFMVIVTEIRGLRLNQRDMGRIRWRGAALSKTLLGRLQKFFSRSAFSVCCAVSL
jgi:hypothetical protein